MQRLGCDVIKARATRFAADWAGPRDEKRDTQTFYNEFFALFGVDRKRLATYEMRVELLAKRFGFIDLFWPGVLLVEQKTSFLDLDKAGSQALTYIDALPDNATPRYLLTCDFHHWRLRDLERGTPSLNFTLDQLPQHIEAFAFMLGRRQDFGSQPAVNIAAAELMGRLHVALEKSGYTGHDLERLLVRLLFCMFADDTGIFEPRDIFLQYIAFDTKEDGSDLGERLNKIFDVLDTEPARRSRLLRDELNAFAHINGALFAGAIKAPDFDKAMRDDLLDACRFDWSKVSPAIFGSLFQSVMAPGDRRQSGAHYTSETNILKVIGPLFLDDVRAEFDAAKRPPGFTGRGTGAVLDANRRRLQELLRRLQRLNFLDPACGCGNFLVVAYRELRTLELDILRELFADQAVLTGFDGAMMCQLDVDQFHGIEIGEFPAEIARVSMWMADHLANNAYDAVFGLTPPRIPLKQSANIVHGDALAVDWNDVLPAAKCNFVMGNPPFVGHQQRDKVQKQGMARIWGKIGQFNRLDYVSCWFRKALDYGKENIRQRFAFVATNSITQGEQAGILWPYLFANGAHIRFAHRTFIWTSEASGAAAVHCVIVGMSRDEPDRPMIYDYPERRGEPISIEAKCINGYLIDGAFIAIPARTKAPHGLPKMSKGSQPTDGARLKKENGGYLTVSNLILDHKERQTLLAQDPDAKNWLRPYVGGDELISGEWRWCLWLKNADPTEISSSAPVRERLKRVRSGRLKSPTPSVRAFADKPTLFTQDRQPSKSYGDYVPCKPYQLNLTRASVSASSALSVIKPATKLGQAGVQQSSPAKLVVRTRSIAVKISPSLTMSRRRWPSSLMSDLRISLLIPASPAPAYASQASPAAS